MNNFYIYRSHYDKEDGNGEKLNCSVTIIFCDRDYIEEVNLQSEIKNFYQENHQTDEIFVIGGAYGEEMLKKTFLEKQFETFKDIPKPERVYLRDNLYLFTFDKKGKLTCVNKPNAIEEEVIRSVIHYGLTNIFINRGGLIEAAGQAHHFVFPSGKHCNKFLRTGNILLHSLEIYFIAFSILGRLDEEVHRQIYCDTSSINTLAFALLELKRKLVGEAFKMIPIESFSSYEGLFTKSKRYFGKSLILISSSTSGNIIKKIIKHDDKVDPQNIVILYFLGSEEDFRVNKSHVLCNLTKNKVSNPTGIEYYDTYTGKDCVYCEKGSYPVEVKGDVFLLERPKINRVTIRVTDAPPRLSEFVFQFKSVLKTTHNVLKVNYKQNNGDTLSKYEVYFDMFHVLSEIDRQESHAYKKYKSKLYDFIHQYVSGSTKYLIALPDEGSEKLAEIILNRLRLSYKEDKLPSIVKFDKFKEEINDQTIEGAAIIVASCISNGKNLLYLSRALRPYSKLKLVYFIGLTRTKSAENLEFLKTNLKQGLYGKETNTFVEVESFHCTNEARNSTWIREMDFLKKLLELAENNGLELARDLVKKRIENIEDSMSIKIKGMANAIFYPNTAGEELSLRKGFAFFNFQDYTNDISQSDVYFTVSAILNRLRNSEDNKQCLKQTEFVRNVIDPGNFNRFNDGIVQASILRGAKNTELSYHIDNGLSFDMKGILEKIVEHHETAQGEALLEFLYAIAIGTLTLKKEHLGELCKMIDNMNFVNETVKLFNIYIKDKVLETKLSLRERVLFLEQQNGKLENELRVHLNSLNPEQDN